MADRLRLLLLEDSQNDALLLLRELKRSGFEVEYRRVETAEAMEAALRDGAWDLIVSDYTMPHFDAPAALRIVAASGLDIPFIVVSGTVGEDIAVQTMKSGAHDYFLKGSLTRLGAAIRREIKEWELRRAHRRNIAKIEHLNRVLLGIRNVNQLIVRERVPSTIIRTACADLVETRGFAAVWIVHTTAEGRILDYAESGLGDDFPQLVAQVESGSLPDCCRRAQETGELVLIEGQSGGCNGCQLRRCGEGDTLTIQLTHDGVHQGFMSVMLPRELPADVDERSLFHEVASDIAFALLTARRADERAELQTDLARSEARFRSIFNQVLDGILVLDLETSKPHLANDAFCRMTGYSDAELRELHVGDFHPVNDIGEVLEGFERHIKGEVQRAEDIPMKRKDGSVFYADINTALVEVDGKSTLVGLFRDVTERKNVQAGLAQADRLSSMGMLAAGVAHEINNPLTYVLYSLESLVHEVPRLRESLRRARADLATRLGDEELVAVVGVESPLVDSQALVEVEERFSDALSGAQRIKTIARGLGTFSRVEKDDPVDIDVAYALECAATIAANEVKYRARLIKDYSPVPPVMATEGRLSQVFLNLIVNAAHAIPEGRIESNEIRISTRREGGEVCVEVRDTGKGIAAENLPRIFEPFFTTKPVGVGSGLGLSISRNIVESYGGRLEVKSQLGRGSSFFVYLPIAGGLARIESSRSISRSDEGGSEATRILVIDDEPAIRAMIRRVLQAYDVVEAASGEEGRQILAEDQSFDLILCDVMMPNVSGMDLHRWLAESFPEVATRVVFITGGAFTPRAREYLERVGNLRLEKPFNVRQLKALVASRTGLR